MGHWDMALGDANESVRLRPSWSRSYECKGAALEVCARQREKEGGGMARAKQGKERTLHNEKERTRQKQCGRESERERG